jgi:hypothetical protein
MADAEGASPPAPRPSARLFVGQNGPTLWRANMHVRSPVRTSLSARAPACPPHAPTDALTRTVEDFAPVPALLAHALRDVLGCDPAEHPMLATEPAWNTPAQRERLAEIAFEEFAAPAFYVANTGVLNACVRPRRAAPRARLTRAQLRRGQGHRARRRHRHVAGVCDARRGRLRAPERCAPGARARRGADGVWARQACSTRTSPSSYMRTPGTSSRPVHAGTRACSSRTSSSRARWCAPRAAARRFC